MSVRKALRQSLVTGDIEPVLDMMDERGLFDASVGFNLQIIGDILLLAIQQKVEDAPSLADMCFEGLISRRWRGDSELAMQLRAALDEEPSSALHRLRPLPVDLDELAGALEGDPVSAGGVLNVETGEVWGTPVVEYAIESGECEADQFEEDCWMTIDNMGSRAGFEDMADFIDVLSDRSVARQLEMALSGRHPFRHFKDALWDRPESEMWQDFSDDRQRGRARKWLAGCGFSPSLEISA